MPAGLGCRDTLRMEMKYVLYGNDINEKTNPIEAGLGWITKTNKTSFIGKEKLIDLQLVFHYLFYLNQFVLEI